MTPAWGSVPVKSNVRWSPALVVATVILCRPRSPSWDWSWYPVADQVPSRRAVSLSRSWASASFIIRFITALTVSAPYWSMRACSRSRPTLLAPILARRSSPMSSGTRERRTHRSATSRWSCPSRTTLTGGVGSDSENTSVAAGGEAPVPTPAQVRLVGDRAGPREQLAVVEDRLVDDHVVLVQAAADPRVVAQEHVALGDAGIGGPVTQGPVDGQVDRSDEHGVVEADLDFLAEIVADGEVEVVGVGDDRRAGHALERLAHLVGDRPQPVPDHFVGERVELVDLFWPNGMGLQPRRKRPAQFLRGDRPTGEDLR